MDAVNGRLIVEKGDMTRAAMRVREVIDPTHLVGP